MLKVSAHEHVLHYVQIKFSTISKSYFSLPISNAEGAARKKQPSTERPQK